MTKRENPDFDSQPEKWRVLKFECEMQMQKCFFDDLSEEQRKPFRKSDQRNP